jgi:ligand-binding SRPBCC domain-containing protein
MGTVRLTRLLPVPADAVWGFVLRPAGMLTVAAPLVAMRPLDPPRLPGRWSPGRYRVGLRAFGAIPLGWQEIAVSFPATPPPERRLRDLGRSPLFPLWDHMIAVTPEAGGTRYTDHVQFVSVLPEALVRPLVAAFFRHRQRRLARALSRPPRATA